MGKVSYLDANIAPFVSRSFHTTWGIGESKITIAFHRQTGRFEFKIGPAYFPSINQLGWHLLGCLDQKKSDSGFRAKMLIDNETGNTLAELRAMYPGNKKRKTVSKSVAPRKMTVYVAKTSPMTAVSSLPKKHQEIADKLVEAMGKIRRPITVEELYNPLKVNYGLSYKERTRLVSKLMHDKVIFKNSNNCYELI